MIARVQPVQPTEPAPRRPLLSSLIATLLFGLVIALCSYPNKGSSSKPVTPAVETKAETPPLPVRAIVICCSDYRFDMIDLIRERYGLKKGEAFPIVMPGGPDPLANSELMCVECEAVKKHIDLILGKKIPSIDTIIVAEHQNCACIEHYGFSDPDHGKKDFPAIKEFFSQRAPDLDLEMLYYSFSNREKGIVNPDPEVITLD